MKDLIRKIFKKIYNSKAENLATKDISQATNAVFEKYEKCFKDLARYDREGKIGVN
jgi:hypothetical protein